MADIYISDEMSFQNVYRQKTKVKQIEERQTTALKGTKVSIDKPQVCLHFCITILGSIGVEEGCAQWVFYS